MCFKADAKTAKRIIIRHSPSAKEKRSATEKRISVDTVAIAIIAAKIGEAQGLETSANKVPTKKGKKNKLPFLFCGNFFMNDGKGTSTSSKRFNPIISITEANKSIKTGEENPAKARPKIAQRIPIMLNTKDNPREKDNI